MPEKIWYVPFFVYNTACRERSIPANTKRGGLFMINLESLSLQEKNFICLLLLKGVDTVCEYVLFAEKTRSKAGSGYVIR
jgi:hypothetical protein